MEFDRDFVEVTLYVIQYNLKCANFSKNLKWTSKKMSEKT